MPKLPSRPAPPASNKPAPRTASSFEIKDWSGEGEGEKIVIYAASGMGKTTLAGMAPDPVFVGLDDGARRIRDPRNGAVLKAVMGIRDFRDLRDCFQQPKIFEGHKTVVLDTITKAEELSEPYLFENYKHEKGHTVKSIEGYGFGKGYRHSLEVMRLLLQDCEGLVRAGFNVILLAQENAITVANAEGMDYLQDGPKLHHNKQYSNRLELCEWADHVLRIGYQEVRVAGEVGAAKGKMVSTDTTRVIHTAASRHFFAKSRTLTEPVIAFAEAKDDSLWRWMMPKEYE